MLSLTGHGNGGGDVDDPTFFHGARLQGVILIGLPQNNLEYFKL
ncbi:MAG: hypothetical protein R2875_04185 [Desulfobacterales bacterium]